MMPLLLQESRCMLGIYFTILLSMFIVMIIGAVIGYSQPLSEIKEPLVNSIQKYDPSSSASEAKTVTSAWDKVQKDVSEARRGEARREAAGCDS